MQGKETARINDVLYLLNKVEEESFFSSEDEDSRLSSKKCQIKDRAMNYETLARGFKHEGIYIFEGKSMEAQANQIGTEPNLLWCYRFWGVILTSTA